MAKKIEDFKEKLEGKSLNDLASNAVNNEQSETEKIEEDFLDNRDYEKYDYREIELEKSTKGKSFIMSLLYIIVIALIVIIILGLLNK